jgi:Vitamin K-dependent gamma-carboxylase
VTHREADLRALGLARILFGALALCRTTPILSPLGSSYLASAAPLLGWPTRLWHIGATGVSLPSQAVAVLCIARTVAMVLFTAGIRAREFGVAAGLMGWIVLFQDAAAYINSMNLLCMGLVVLALSGAGSALAITPEREHDVPSARALTRAFVVSVYAWSGLAKLNASWLSGDALAHFRDAGMVHGALAGAVLTSSLSRAVTSWMIAALELGMGPLLLWPRTRSVGIAVALAFHAALEWTVQPDFFGFQIAVLLLSFASDHQPQRQGPVVQAAV